MTETAPPLALTPEAYRERAYDILWQPHTIKWLLEKHRAYTLTLLIKSGVKAVASAPTLVQAAADCRPDRQG